MFDRKRRDRLERQREQRNEQRINNLIKNDFQTAEEKEEAIKEVAQEMMQAIPSEPNPIFVAETGMYYEVKAGNQPFEMYSIDWVAPKASIDGGVSIPSALTYKTLEDQYRKALFGEEELKPPGAKVSDIKLLSYGDLDLYTQSPREPETVPALNVSGDKKLPIGFEMEMRQKIKELQARSDSPLATENGVLDLIAEAYERGTNQPKSVRFEYEYVLPQPFLTMATKPWSVLTESPPKEAPPQIAPRELKTGRHFDFGQR